ncbi:MAG: hypothetical protein HY855_06870 [Burkholderiales bacterium]|nr:hypothetical protein [Burkholderiales bacterium]
MNLSLTFNPADRGDHIKRASAWLEVANGGVNMAAITYAALELRFGIERLAVEYLHAFSGRPASINDEDWKVMRSHSNVVNEIFRLAGKQPEIDRAFDFMRAFLEVGGIDLELITPNVGQLKRHWQECSEALHFAAPMISEVPVVQAAAMKSMMEIAEEMKTLVRSAGWPNLAHPQIIAIRDQFVSGAITLQNARAALVATGLLSGLRVELG